jgi:hypothetical protein
MGLIGSIVCTPTKVHVGQSMLIEVKAPDGRSYDGNELVHVSINGRPGAKQYVQFGRAGQRALVVLAAPAPGHAGSVEKKTATVEVEKVDDEAVPLIRALRRHESPATVHLSLISPLGPGRVKRPPRNPEERKRRRLAPGRRAGGRLTQPLYRWEFGDGKTATSMHPNIAHDYSARIDHSKLHTLFHLKVTVTPPGGVPREIRRTVSVLSTYALAKRRGYLEPIVETSLNAARVRGGFSAMLDARNLEDEAITLTSRRFQPLFDDPDHPCVPSAPERISLRIEPKGKLRTQALIPTNKLPRDAVGFAVHYSGVSGRQRVRFSVYYDLPARHRARMDNPELIRILDRLRRRSLGQTFVSVRALDEYESATRPDRPLRPLRPSRPLRPPQPMGGDASFTVGQECFPDDLPTNIPEGIVCQATEESEWVWIPDRFINARKGDIVLTPGGDTIVAKLMRSVQPKQVYSHSGIMTKNFEHITHSTGSIARLIDHPNGDIEGTPAPTNGFTPEALQFLWPGAITQSIEGALQGEKFKDPTPGPDVDNPTYTISGFDADETIAELEGGELEVIPPVVIKPDPAQETAAVRHNLHHIADRAASLAVTASQNNKGTHGGSYYSLFCYTDPSKGLTFTAPDGAGWAKDAFPSCCSSFIWINIKQTAEEQGFSINFEQSLESDEAFVAEKAPSTPDGLYKYTADERLQTGELVFEEVKQLIRDFLEEEAGILSSAIGTFEDIGDDCGNQICNAFASDNCSEEAKDLDDWRDQHDADAVSADDLMLWDAPSLGGLYGYVEPLIFRPGRFEQVYKHVWQKVTVLGTLKGTVKFNGEKVAGARVEIPGYFVHTGSDGRFDFKTVPAGNYTLSAEKIFDESKRVSTKQQVTVPPHATADINVELQGPNPRFREVKVTLRIVTRDYHLVGSNVVEEKTFAATLYVHPDKTHDEKGPYQCIADGCVWGKGWLTADLQPNNNVKMGLRMKLLDGPDNDDLLMEEDVDFTINADDSGNWHYFMDDGNPGDRVDMYLTVHNFVDWS